MNRRGFLFSAGAALGGAVFVTKYGRWFREGSGLLVREDVGTLEDLSSAIYSIEPRGGFYSAPTTLEAMIRVEAKRNAYFDLISSGNLAPSLQMGG